MALARQNDLVFKVIVVGDSGCGKSCLIQRYLTNEFADDYTVTLGVEYHSKSVKIDSTISVKLQFWDTAGQEAFYSLVKSFYRNAHAVVLVFDITRRQTFENLDIWQQQALENSPQEAFYILIGTHLDLAASYLHPNLVAKSPLPRPSPGSNRQESRCTSRRRRRPRRTW
jgi:small GTP-binding protein